MQTLSTRFPIWIFCLFGFISAIGIGIALPTFSFIALEPNTVLALSSDRERTLLLGLLLAIAPFISIFTAPLAGIIADLKGRKTLLIAALFLTALGSILAALGIYEKSIPFLIFSRIVAGVGLGGAAVLSAAISDISAPETKSKNYALLNTTFSLGFMIGPLIGGELAVGGDYARPFLWTAALTGVNLLLMYFGYKDRYQPKPEEKIERSFFSDLKVVFYQYPKIRLLLFSSPLFSIGFMVYWQFIAVNWIQEYHLSEMQVGDLYSYGAICFALSSGLFIQPLLKRFRDLSLVLSSSFALTFLTLLLFFRTGIEWFLICIPFQQFFLSILSPTATAFISNGVKETDQGKIMGVLQSLESASFALSPILGGWVAGIGYNAHILFGGIILLLFSCTVLVGYRFEIFINRT